jgi:hypothetical protein
MKAITSPLLGITLATAMLALVTPSSATAANWSRNFDNGTVQGLLEWDYGVLFGIDGFHPTVVNQALRMKYDTGDGNDIGLVYDGANVFTGDASAKMLIKWSTNPLFLTNPSGPDMEVGFFIRLDPQVDTLDFKGYIVLLNDQGQLALTTLVGLQVYDPCPINEAYVPGFDPATSPASNWWIKAEAVNVPDPGVAIRVKAWKEGTPEPAEWHLECTDTSYLFASGVVGVAAREKDFADRSNNQSFVDVDDVSAVTLELCYNHIDDDGNGLTDCADPRCGGNLACTCHDPFADLDGDGDVDAVDFAIWQRYYTLAGTTPGGAFPECLDRNDTNGDHLFDPVVDGDGAVDLGDFSKFAACASGPGIPANPACDDTN